MCMICDTLKARVLRDEEARQQMNLLSDEKTWTQFRANVTAIAMLDGTTLGKSAIGDVPLRFCPECGANIARSIRQWKGIPSYPPRQRRKQDE